MEAAYVIIGGGIAGVSCVETLSVLCPDESVILVSATPVIKMTTNIIPLTRMLTEFNIEEKSFDFISSIHPRCDVICDTVASINSAKHTIRTVSDKVIKYNKLCVCSGAVPKVISTDNPHVIGIRDTDSAKELQRKLSTAKRVAVIGNGGIATEVVYEIKGVEIIWVIKDKHISATFVDPGAAEFFKDRFNNQDDKPPRIIKRTKYTADDNASKMDIPGAALGPDWHNHIKLCNESSNDVKITLEYNAEVKSVIQFEDLADDEVKNVDKIPYRNENWPVFVKLTNGKIYGCNFIISATGVIPNSRTIQFEDNTEFNVTNDNGIEVDWKMETNVSDIFAAGDVCTAAWPRASQWIQMRLWTQARQMGSYAARCMFSTLHNEPFLQDFCFELFTHVTRFYGYKVILIGLFNGQMLNNGYEILLRVTKGQEYVKLILHNGRLQGAVLIGETDLEEMCENLILNQLDLTQYGEDLLNPFIDIEDYFD